MLGITALVCPMGAAHADGLGTTLGNIFSFSGFGTVGATHSNEHLADFVGVGFKPNGAGYTHDWSMSVDSLLGLQLNARFLPQLSAVVQVITEQQFDDTYRPSIEWANLNYQPTPDLSIRVGRTVMPVFAAAEYWQVGYANPWVRPPTEVYGLSPLPRNDGIEVSYRMDAGDVINTVLAYYGDDTVQLPPPNGDGRGRNLWGISDSADYGHLTVRAALQVSHVSIASLDTLFNVFRLLGPQGVEIANEASLDYKPIYVMVGGVNYDPGRWFVMGEWGHDASDSILGGETAWYVTAGYRYRQLTPYVTYVQKSAKQQVAGLDIAALPPSAVPEGEALNAALESFSASADETVSLGARWDFYKNVDLKLQYDHTRLAPGSHGDLTNVQPGFQPGSTYSLISATVDFVF